MNKKLCMLVLSLCLLFSCPLSVAATSSDDAAAMQELLARHDVVWYLNSSNVYPGRIPLYGANMVTALGYRYSFSFDDYGNGNYEGLVKAESATGGAIRISGEISFYMHADLPDLYNNTYGSGTLRQEIGFSDIDYIYVYNGTTYQASVINPKCRVTHCEMVSAIGQTYTGGCINSGAIGSSAMINYRFNDAGMGVGNEFVRLTVAYNFEIKPSAAPSVSAEDMLNGYGRLYVSSSTGYVDFDSGFLNAEAFNKRYSTPVVNALESQQDELLNGYDGESNAAVLESNASVVESAGTVEKDIVESAGSLTSDFSYEEQGDLSSLASAFALISSWFTMLLEALGSWSMLIYISLTMIIALFAIGFFRHK